MAAARLAEQLKEAALHQSRGDHELADRLLARLAEEHPGDARTLGTYGCFLKDRGRAAEAVALHRRAIELKPAAAPHWCNLGAAYQDGGNLQAALHAYRKATSLDPSRWEAYLNIAMLLQDRNEFAGAEMFYAHAIRVKPDCGASWGGLARLYARLRRLEEAIPCFEKALSLDPTADLYCDLAQVLAYCCRFEPALEAAQQAIALNPGLAMAHVHAGSILCRKGRHMDGKRAFEAALSSNPNCSPAMAGIAGVATAFCDWEEAIGWYVRAIENAPERAPVHSSLLFALTISGMFTPERQLDEHRLWGRLYGGGPPSAHVRGPRQDPARRLRIGFVSGDFRDHAVRFFIAPILRNLDRERFDVVCYSESAHADSATGQLRSLAGEWREIPGCNDIEAEAQIRRDAIDILVDLSGHTTRNRLTLFARKPAPLQVTYLGYLNTSGLDAMDYWLTDWVLHGEDTKQRTSERIWRLPRCWVAYEPPVDAPAVSERDGAEPLVFGSFNALQKLSPESLNLWARVLAEVPASTLSIKTVGLDGPAERAILLARLQRAGLPASRVKLMGQVPSRREHLSLYGQVDIALDTTPFCGGTTTAEALWMGVPVVTLAGDPMSARMSASMLHAVGLDRWIAADEDSFVRIAVELARDGANRSRMRRELRPRMAASPLCDGADLARQVGNAFRGMWAEWCAAAPEERAVTA